MDKKQKPKFRSYVVDRRFQFKYIKMVATLVVVMTAIGGAASYSILRLGMSHSGIIQEDLVRSVQPGNLASG